jgi:anthranilate synthase component 2
VFRNDKVDVSTIANYDALVFSPGPGVPSMAGQMFEIIQEFHLSIPMLGICLGMQAIGEIFGANLVLLDRPIHGFSAKIKHFGDDLFKSLPLEFEAARYHSWVLEAKSILNPLKVIAETEDEKVMAIKHSQLPIYGLQFHPESVLTKAGIQLIKNFLTEAKKHQYAKVTR